MTNKISKCEAKQPGFFIEDERNQPLKYSAPAQGRILDLFDSYAEILQRAGTPPTQAITVPIASALLEFRAAVPPGEWKQFCGEIRNHSLNSFLHQDPFTSYGFRKPRGYPGDAELIDFIYGEGESSAAASAATPLGSTLYREIFQHSSSEAIRARRDHLANQLLELGKARGRTTVLSVACGRLREGHALQSVPKRLRPDRFVAVDQDPGTLEHVSAEHRAIGVQTVCATVLDLIRSGPKFGSFDFIYSAGLYDYLSDSISFRLLSALTQMLRPGGRLVIANMTPDLSSAAYIEAIMDWWLEFRTEAQLETLGNRLAADSPHLAARVSAHTFVAYLEIESRAGGDRLP
jgi:SAM-dependent methyltransferase